MLMTSAIRNNVVPIWNEVKNWSREDRSNLYELLEVSLDESQASVEGEENVLDQIDENLMRQCFELAHQEYLAGKGTPNSEIVDRVKEELGWR